MALLVVASVVKMEAASGGCRVMMPRICNRSILIHLRLNAFKIIEMSEF